MLDHMVKTMFSFARKFQIAFLHGCATMVSLRLPEVDLLSCPSAGAYDGAVFQALAVLTAMPGISF